MTSEIEDIATQLSRLEQLRSSGTLTDDEFQRLKGRLLSENHSTDG